ncbi:tRNA dihydrouridine synthase [Rubinisphaera italica]|uniref:tRNA-dihydrouridine synthase n=1 Tax=Rubinisphaera italica TaxID=2527969 RepID=A0A5C5XGK5_9PLAN|nr:tRNA-dihydrouridine synthase [Rubinisphaera italica]TWT61944.1 tRNA-dihydrouridine synthase C [Rubinisphaera italica]
MAKTQAYALGNTQRQPSAKSTPDLKLYMSSNPSNLDCIEETSNRIRIGNRLLDSRYFLAPLAGYTHLPLRTALRELGGVGLATTDLVLVPQLIANSNKSKALIRTNDFDQPLSVQIFGGNTDELIQASQKLETEGYGGIDINMGCPMGKINSSGGGARLMRDCENATRIVSSVVNAVSIPVTVKMRLGWDADHISAPMLAAQFEQLGVAAITIHGRTRQQGFHGDVDLVGIRQVVEAVNHIPIIGNGDVRNVNDALDMRRITGCDAVAIGRGAMLDPWIFRKLKEMSNGKPINEPTPAEQIAFLVRHFELMVAAHEEYACVLFRKFAAWYGSRLGIPEDLEDRLRTLESTAMFDTLIQEIEQRHGERESSVPTALVKVPNGPNANW